jgi:outer membrane murein-binding lipoprotein Lpp
MQTQRTTALTIIAAVAVIVALAGVGIAVVSLNKGSQDKTSVHRLEAKVRVLTAHTGGATASVTSRVGELEAKVKALEGRTASFAKTIATVGSLSNCVPELQSEIGGLSLKEDTTEGYITNAYINNPTNISKNCQNILYGTGG